MNTNGIQNGSNWMIFINTMDAWPGENKDAHFIQNNMVKLMQMSTAIAFSTNSKLNINGETVDITSKDHGEWSDKQLKKISWSLSSEDLYLEKGEKIYKQDTWTVRSFGFYDLFDLMINRKKIFIAFSNCVQKRLHQAETLPAEGWSVDSGLLYYGYARITSIECNASQDEKATFTVNFEGDGELYENRR